MGGGEPGAGRGDAVPDRGDLVHGRQHPGQTTGVPAQPVVRRPLPGQVSPDRRPRLRGVQHLRRSRRSHDMIENSFYTHEFHGDYDLVSIGRLDLEEGGSSPDCQLAVTTWGELNEAKDNAILITTWYSGTHQIWRDVYVGPDHALNPERYFIVAI